MVTTIAMIVAMLVPRAEPAWVEITMGQPFADDITYLGSPLTDEIWIGTSIGEIYRSFDNGLTWEIVFQPISYDNLLDIKTKQLRTPTLNIDLLRSLKTNIPVRDREGASQRVLDLAGNTRGRQRLPTAKVLGSLVANEVRDPGQINQIDRCFDYIFVNASNGIWRAMPGEPLRFDLIETGRNLGEGRVTWLSCDRKRPGHIAGKTATGTILETEDYGDSWHPYTNPFVLSHKASTAGFSEGRLNILAGGRMFREREDRRGYDELCTFMYDSKESEPAWVWRTDGPAFGITADGVTICDHNRFMRITDERLAHKTVAWFQIEGPKAEHMLVATTDDVFLSHDGGKTFTLMFSRVTQRSIDMVIVDDLSTFEGALVWSGNVVYRRSTPVHEPTETSTDVQEIFNKAPMWEVIEVGLRHGHVDAGQIAARRDDARLQGLLPLIRASYNYRDTDGFVEKGDRTKTGVINTSDPLYFNRNSYSYPDRAVWTVIAAWDVADLLRSRSSTDRSWADVERLRRRMTYRLEDAYTRWANTTLELRRVSLDVRQRSHLEVQRREMAAYLNYMTGGYFDAFGGKTAL
jgi:hypothetical protein